MIDEADAEKLYWSTQVEVCVDRLMGETFAEIKTRLAQSDGDSQAVGRAQAALEAIKTFSRLCGFSGELFHFDDTPGELDTLFLSRRITMSLWVGRGWPADVFAPPLNDAASFASRIAVLDADQSAESIFWEYLGSQ